MSSLLATFSGLTRLTLVVAAVGLAIWAFRRFGITAFIWLILAKASEHIASLMVTAPDPEGAMKAFQRLQGQLDSGLGEAYYAMLVVPPALSLLSSICLLLIAAAELGHFGPKLSGGYEASRSLVFAYRCRYLVGALAVLFSVVPSLVFAYVMRSPAS